MFLLSYPIFSFMFITLFIYSPFINVRTWPKRTFWSFITKPRFLIVYREQKICFQTFPISKNICWSVITNPTMIETEHRTRLFYLARSAQTWQRDGSIKCGICWDNAPSKLAPGTITATIHLPQHGALWKQFKFLVISIWGWLSQLHSAAVIYPWCLYCKVTAHGPGQHPTWTHVILT